MGKENKRILGFIAFGVVAYAVLMNLGSVIGSFRDLISLTLPVIVGLVLAFVINVPMKAFEKLYGRIFGKLLKKQSKGGKTKGKIRGCTA